MNNLLSNARRHTPSGGLVETTVAAIEDGAIGVQIRDTGSAMTQDEIDHACDRFQKGPDSHGSGLGLTIARNLIALHGGEISATSEPGSGTTIKFTLSTTPDTSNTI